MQQARASMFVDSELAVGVDSPDDLADLYRALASPLRQIVRFTVRAPESVIDDACQIAWSRLLNRWGSIRRETVLPWLARTASREALRALRRSTRDLSLDELGDRAAMQVAPSSPDQIAEFRARLDELRALPERQQRRY